MCGMLLAGNDPLAGVITGIKDSAAQDGLTDAEAHAEFADRNGEHPCAAFGS